MTNGDSSKPLSFVDSNIWLYAFIEGEDTKKSESARSVIGSDDIVISSQVINEVCVNLIRQASFSERDIRSLVYSFYQNYRVVDLNRETVILASKLRENHALSFWDSHIVAVAFYSGSEKLITEDLQDGQKIGTKLAVVNPFRS